MLVWHCGSVSASKHLHDTAGVMLGYNSSKNNSVLTFLHRVACTSPRFYLHGLPPLEWTEELEFLQQYISEWVNKWILNETKGFCLMQKQSKCQKIFPKQNDIHMKSICSCNRCKCLEGHFFITCNKLTVSSLRATPRMSFTLRSVIRCTARPIPNERVDLVSHDMEQPETVGLTESLCASF